VETVSSFTRTDFVCSVVCDQTAIELLRAPSHHKNTGLPECGKPLPCFVRDNLLIAWLFDPILPEF
jgi:hypothetical protein